MEYKSKTLVFELKSLFMKTFSFISDVITIEKTNEYFRLIYDVKGRFTVHRISAEEAKVCVIQAVC